MATSTIKKTGNLTLAAAAFLLAAFLPARGFCGWQNVLASFSTSVEDQDDAVRTNIHLSCRKINGHVLAPGAVFSFNEIVGEGSARNGFVNGRVLYLDEVRYEPGGGLCQVSSTLFNAFLLAGCAIVERKRHYQPVSYVPLGLDAAIKYGKKDLKMKNTLGRPLLIEMVMNAKSLMVTVRAENPPSWRYEIYTEEEELEIPLAGPGGDIRNAIDVYVYRKKFSGEKLLESFLLYKDHYPPVYRK